jgi:RNA polymerase sigma-70 factor (ECF subfamily)
MHERAGLLPTTLISVDAELAREFEARLAESATLAFRVAYAVLRHREDAEDVAQEAFARAYRRFLQLRDRDRFRAWLVRMTWRLAIDRQRATRRRLAHEAGPVTPRVVGSSHAMREGKPPEAMTALLEHERAEQLWAAIDALPDKLRVVIVLSSIEEHDVADVARLLDLPEGTVKSRLFLARQRLREYLQCTIRG